MKVEFKINKSNDNEYYSVNGFSFAKDDVSAVFYEIVQDCELTSICPFLSDRWPLKYGEAINLMIKEGYYPENFEDDKEELNGLYGDELFYALCKYQLDSFSFFSDQFAEGKLETNSMLKSVCDFINELQMQR